MVPSDEEKVRMGPEKLRQLNETYNEAIKNAAMDPLRYGFELEPWADFDKLLTEWDEVHAYGGNRSSKTTCGARTVVKAAIENYDATILCFSQDAHSSVRVQQKAVYEWLPAELKRTTRTDTGYIKYSIKNGFTGDSLIIPETRSTIAFHTYSQFQGNPGKFEGLELGSLNPRYTNIGLWLDEYLLGSDLVDTLRFRLATRDAKMILTFTPIDGITEFLNSYVTGAETLEWRDVDLFDEVHERVPYIQRASRRPAAMIYFHSDKNPFGGWQRLVKDLKGRSRSEILTRFYGIPVKMLTGQFPMFKRNVNVMKHSDMMQTVGVDSKVTRYMVIDPAPNKRWYIAWIAVDREGNWYVYRDWPDIGYGEWAEMGANNKSRLAEASRPDGKGIREYVELIEQLENGEKIFERLIDPRMGASPRQVEDGTTTIIQQLDEQGMIVLQAPGGLEDHGLTALRSKMAWNDSRELDATNRPQFYISEECEQTIQCILNYTGMEGPTEAWKDGIDVLRYAAAAEIDYVDEVQLQTRRRGSGGY